VVNYLVIYRSQVCQQDVHRFPSINDLKAIQDSDELLKHPALLPRPIMIDQNSAEIIW